VRGGEAGIIAGTNGRTDPTKLINQFGFLRAFLVLAYSNDDLR
jgi:hypothetical protein